MIDWLFALARRFGAASAPPELAELQTALAALTQAAAAQQTAVSDLREMVDKLDRQVVKAGKEQFKANTLAEAQEKTIQMALEQLREALAAREREAALLREQLTSARRRERLELIQSLLPVLDGLDEAAAAGERLLKNAGAPIPTDAPRRRAPLSRWFRAALRTLSGGDVPPERNTPPDTLSPDAMAAWLRGLALVQERLLSTLAAEGVHPLEAEGEPFDPYRHVALETIPADGAYSEGVIVHELRRGYVHGETVLRYAEVVVAR